VVIEVLDAAGKEKHSLGFKNSLALKEIRTFQELTAIEKNSGN